MAVSFGLIVLPILVATYLTRTHAVGANRRLWLHAAAISAALVPLVLIHPNLVIYYEGPLNAAGVYTVTFPFAVLSAAAGISVTALLTHRPWVHGLIASVLAIAVANSLRWIA
jgi:hypothetical protein